METEAPAKIPTGETASESFAYDWYMIFETAFGVEFCSPGLYNTGFFIAVQMLCAQATYLNFCNGSGVPFITQYSQAATPITNDSPF